MLLDAVYDGDLVGAVDWARRVEASDLFSGAWVSDTTNDPFCLAQQMIACTERITIGTNVAVAFARSPFCMAQTTYNLSELSAGRFALGLGTQVKAHIERRFSAHWPDRPVRAMVEYVELLRHLYDCFDKRERPSFRGDYFSCTLTSPVFTPDRSNHGSPTVGFAAVGPLMTQAAGRVADRVFLHPFTHPKFVRESSLPALEKGVEKRDPALSEVEVVGFAFAVASDVDDHKERLQECVGRLAFYASTPNYRAVLESLELGDLQEELNALSRQGRWQEMAALIPKELIEACIVVAPREELASRLEERYGKLYDRVLIDPRPLLS